MLSTSILVVTIIIVTIIVTITLVIIFIIIIVIIIKEVNTKIAIITTLLSEPLQLHRHHLYHQGIGAEREGGAAGMGGRSGMAVGAQRN
jgi:hypothetical protein